MSSKKVTLNMQQRIQVLEDLKTLPVRIVAAKYRIHPQTVRRIQKKEIYIREFAAKGKTGQKQQRMKKPVYPELEEQLYTWFCERTALGDRISDLLLQEKAVELQQSSATSSRCKVSMSWVSNFKRRHNIRLVSVCGEKASADTNAAESFIQYFQRHIEQEGIDIENVYNMDESGLFWKALPIKTLSTEKNVAGFKMKKDRITFGLCANVTGTNKIKPLVVHKYKKPRALKHSLHRLPVCYKSQKNAWVDREIFQDWYEQHFKPSVREHQLRKGITGKVILLLDNCASHQVPLSEDDDTFSIQYLPPNTTALLQPMDQGVILKTKRIFQKEMCRSILTYEGGVNEFYANYNIKDCIDILIQAWGEVTPENIRHSWHKIIPAPVHIQSYFRNESEDDGLEDAISVISDGQISQQQAAIFLNTCRIEEEEVPQSDADNQDSNNESEQDSDNEDEHNIQSPQEQIKYKLQCLKYHIMRASCLTTELQDLTSS